jgi:hypothetical protein
MRRIAFALGVVFGIAVLLGAASAGAGDGASAEAFCDTHPPYKHPFPIDGGNIQVGAP